MDPAKRNEIRSLYRDRFLPGHDESWVTTYLDAVQSAAAVSRDQFRSADYQRFLWEVDGVADLGPGSSVTVPGAYTDVAVIDALWNVRQLPVDGDVAAFAQHLDAEFDRIIELVSPRHNARRPLARLARIFATLRSREVLCLLERNRTSEFRRWLEVPKHKLGFIGEQVHLREALRDILGTEQGLRDNVTYSQFSWFVWDHLLKKEDPQATTAVPVLQPRATATPRLTVLPAKAQRKGMPYVANNLALLMTMVRAAENGIDRHTLDQQIAEEAPQLERSSRGNVMAQASTLGVLSYANGTYLPTAAGRTLLEGEPATDVLTPVFVRLIFGFAQIMDDLGQRHSMTRRQIGEACRGYYPRWTTDFASNQLVAWMEDLELVEVTGTGKEAQVELTEVGEYWRSGLPPEMKAPSLLLTDARRDELEKPLAAAVPEDGEVGVKSFNQPPIETILRSFHENEHLRFFVFSDIQISLVHAALHSAATKRFILLAGLSGTGKTSLAQGYARAYCEALNLPFENHFLQVAVWPDWTDPTGLLGFVNPLATPPSFQHTEALRFLLTASRNPDKPYFLCLDEMNLARVEHYFAPFLSAMEGPAGHLSLHTGSEAVDGITPSIPWPTNLFILGTVNMDETTHPFSDKVLDRAFSFEFWDVDLDRWHALALTRGAAPHGDLLPALKALSEALKPARRHFGYRTCDEVLGFLGAATGIGFAAALDAAVLAKILPKVRGDSGGTLPAAIAAVIAVSKQYGLTDSVRKLEEMQATLNELGAVRFWA